MSKNGKSSLTPKAKEAADGTLCYLLYDWDEKGQYVKAHEGQWLCEGYDGKWTVTDEPPAL